MSRSDQSTPNLYRTFHRYGRSMEAGKPCAAMEFHTFHTFRTCSPAACAYGCERPPARTRTRVHLSLFMYGKYGRYGRGPQDKDFQVPDLCHTSIRYGTAARQGHQMLLDNSRTILACRVGLLGRRAGGAIDGHSLRVPPQACCTRERRAAFSRSFSALLRGLCDAA